MCSSALAGLCALIPSVAVTWQIAEEPCLARLYDQADLVVMGEVIDKQSRRGNLVDVWISRTSSGTSRDVSEYEFTLTDYTIRTSETFKQAASGDTVEFTSRGGELEDGSRQVYLIAYDLELGDEVLLFLRWDEENQWYQPQSATYGTFILEQNAGYEPPVYIWLASGSATRNDDACTSPDLKPEGRTRDDVLANLIQLSDQSNALKAGQ